jgi:hypothetical protein
LVLEGLLRVGRETIFFLTDLISFLQVFQKC